MRAHGMMGGVFCALRGRRGCVFSGMMAGASVDEFLLSLGLEKYQIQFRLEEVDKCGGSAYPRDWDYAGFRAFADKCGALLLCDMAHISGLVVAQVCGWKIWSPYFFGEVLVLDLEINDMGHYFIYDDVRGLIDANY